jgi:hypothetical protein
LLQNELAWISRQALLTQWHSRIETLRSEQSPRHLGQQRLSWTLWVAIECLGVLTTFLASSEDVHLLVERPPSLDGYGVGETGGLLPVSHVGNIDIIGGPEILCLASGFDFVKVEWASLSAAEPRIISQQRSGPVVRMSVDGPVSEEDIGFLIEEEIPELPVPSRCNFGASVGVGQCDEAAV